jgi:hypothetical protein
MTQEFFKSVLEYFATGVEKERNIILKTGRGGITEINRQIRQLPIREHLKAARDLGTVNATRFGQLIGMLDNPDTEIQKLAEGIVLGLKI